MPRYNYECEKCKLFDLLDNIDKIDDNIVIMINSKLGKDQVLVWEVIRRITDESEVLCPVCGKKALQTYRNIDSIPGAVIKGRVYENRIVNRLHSDKALVQENDPYGQWRQPGETEQISKYLDKKIREAGGGPKEIYGVKKLNNGILSISVKFIKQSGIFDEED